MKPMTAAEKFNMMRPSVFFDDWRELDWPMRAMVVLIYTLYLSTGLIALAGVALVVHLLFKGEWAFLLVVGVICLLLTPSGKQ